MTGASFTWVVRKDHAEEIKHGVLFSLAQYAFADWRRVIEVASCLGHSISLKGIYGHPRNLVVDAVRRLCEAIKATSPTAANRFVLVNTTGNSNRDLDEHVSFGQRCVIGLLHPSPTRSAIFNPGLTSRINVGHFMAALITDDDTWKKWKGQMPVIYNVAI